jgi:hypothetical protein
MKTERRVTERIPANHNVEITVLSVPDAPELENKTFDCQSEDISANGIRFSVDASLPKDCPIELRINDETTHNGFWHVGRVVWVSKPDGAPRYEVGVRFTETPEATLEAWAKLLAEKLARKTH